MHLKFYELFYFGLVVPGIGDFTSGAKAMTFLFGMMLDVLHMRLARFEGIVGAWRKRFALLCM